MCGQLPLWIVFGVVVAGLLALDLGVLHRRAHEPSLRNAAVWTGVWVVLALGFNLVVYWLRGPQEGLEFLTGYLLEWTLSMDNVFVFAVLFSYFAVPPAYQHRVLFWGILGAIVMRVAFVLLGAALLERFHWVSYVFGAIVFLAGMLMYRHRYKERDLGRNPLVIVARRCLRLTPSFVGDRLVVRQDGVWTATPLLLVLLVVEATDVGFAVDSVPAIFGITHDPFIVITSNIFAVLGLRALYFLLAGAIGKFRYLCVGLAFVLCFVGTKMLLSDLYAIPTGLSLLVIAVILGTAIGLSLRFPGPWPGGPEGQPATKRPA